MNVIPYYSFGPQLGEPMVPLFEPDNGGKYGLRYLWITHRTDNDKFVDNYFNPQGSTGLNIRKQTAEHATLWQFHNSVFEESAKDGNLIWRVKVFNKFSRSIDYIEIWKNKETVIKFFGPDTVFPGNKISVPAVPGWINTVANELGQNLYNVGFSVKNWYPVQTVSERQAREVYEHFLSEARQKNKCIINTPWQQNIPLGI